MFEAIERGAIKALWVMGTNPAVSLPRADAMRAALKKLDFLVVSEMSAPCRRLIDAATVVLPAAAWGEKDGTVTNSERRISRQRPFLPLPGEALPDWWIVCEVARRLGHGEAFAYGSRPTSFASMRRCRRSRMTARARSTSARWPTFDDAYRASSR